MGNNLTNNDFPLIERGSNWVSDKRANTIQRWRSVSISRNRTEPEHKAGLRASALEIYQDDTSSATSQSLRSAMKRTSQPVINSSPPPPLGGLRVSKRHSTTALETPTASGTGNVSPRVTFAPNLPPIDPSDLESDLESMSVHVRSGESYKYFDEYFEKAENELQNSSFSLEGPEKDSRHRSSSHSKEANGTRASSGTGIVQRNLSFALEDNDTAKIGTKDERVRDNGKKTSANLNRKRTGSVATQQQESHLRHCMSTGELRRQSLFQRRQSNKDLAAKMSTTARMKTSSSTDINRKLTPPQMHLIRQAWNQLMTTKGRTVLGMTVLQRVFFKAPLIKESFLKSPLPKEFSSHDKLLNEHAKLVSNLIDTLVKNLDDLEGMSPMLIDIGKHHASLSEYGFTPKFWNVFAEAFIDCTMEWGEKNKRGEETWRAWALIASYMIEKIKLGYIEERRLRIGSLATAGATGSANS